MKQSKEVRDRTIITMYKQGHKVSSISSKLCINIPIIYKVLKDHKNSVVDDSIDVVEQGQEVVSCSNIEAIKEIDAIEVDKVTKGIIIESFENWERIGVNQYYSKVTNQIINVEFIAGTPYNGYIDKVLTV